MPTNKKIVLRALISKLSEELETLVRSAKAAHEAATHEESKAEDQYDTRGLESSYLAAAQIQRAEELQRQIQFFSVTPEDSHHLITLQSEENEETCYFLTRFAGGTKLSLEEKNILVITAESPIGAELSERKPGDFIEVQQRGKTKELEIISFL
jgi:transcription elongation GreA/GreB family factor